MLLFGFSLESGSTYSFPNIDLQDSGEYTVREPVKSHAGFSFTGLTFEILSSIDFDIPESIDGEQGYLSAHRLAIVTTIGGHCETFVLGSAYVNGGIIISIDSEIPRRAPPVMAAVA